MPQKYGHKANFTGEDPVICQVCENQDWSWTDRHGEAYCTKCGTPHIVVSHLEGIERGTCGIRDESIPIIRQYHQETGHGCGLGSFFLWNDYLDQLLDRKRFNEWLQARMAKEEEAPK